MKPWTKYQFIIRGGQDETDSTINETKNLTAKYTGEWYTKPG